MRNVLKRIFELLSFFCATLCVPADHIHYKKDTCSKTDFPLQRYCTENTYFLRISCRYKKRKTCILNGTFIYISEKSVKAFNVENCTVHYVTYQYSACIKNLFRRTSEDNHSNDYLNFSFFQ